MKISLPNIELVKENTHNNIHLQRFLIFFFFYKRANDINSKEIIKVKARYKYHFKLLTLML